MIYVNLIEDSEPCFFIDLPQSFWAIISVVPSEDRLWCFLVMEKYGELTEETSAANVRKRKEKKELGLRLSIRIR